MKTAEAVWASVLARISRCLSPHELETWFSGVCLAGVTPEKVRVQVPSLFHASWFENHYRDLLAEALEAETGARPALQFEVPSGSARQQSKKGEPRPAPAAHRQAPTPGFVLNQNYVFSRFVTGPSNQLAHAAALAVVEAPGTAYNPLFLHGGIGLGKTHLMQAIAHSLLKRRPELGIRYFSCEEFMNQFIYALQKGGIERFRARCRQVDVLLIDDVHILAHRPATQEEFFYTFNELYNAQKQIVLSSDSAPEDMTAFEERVISRFKWGLVARVDPPCFETRKAIVRKKAEGHSRVLPEEVVTLIAETASGNIRELEGAVLRTIGYSSLTRRPLDLALAREALRADQPRPARSGVISCEQILDAVAAAFAVRQTDIQGKTRVRSVALARQVCMYLGRRLTGKSLEETGGAFGGRDHSTVAHACANIARRLEADPDLKATIESLEQRLRAPRPPATEETRRGQGPDSVPETPESV